MGEYCNYPLKAIIVKESGGRQFNFLWEQLQKYDINYRFLSQVELDAMEAVLCLD